MDGRAIIIIGILFDQGIEPLWFIIVIDIVILDMG